VVDAEQGQVTDEALLRHPDGGMHDGQRRVCSPNCPVVCDGDCGCEAWLRAWLDFQRERGIKKGKADNFAVLAKAERILNRTLAYQAAIAVHELKDLLDLDVQELRLTVTPANLDNPGCYRVTLHHHEPSGIRTRVTAVKEKELPNPVGTGMERLLLPRCNPSIGA
jgi:hypothetical protein